MSPPRVFIIAPGVRAILRIIRLASSLAMRSSLFKLAIRGSIDGEMAVDFLNSGNSILEQAATSWAAQHHYQIVTKYGSSKHLKWGVYQ